MSGWLIPLIIGATVACAIFLAASRLPPKVKQGAKEASTLDLPPRPLSEATGEQIAPSISEHVQQEAHPPPKYTSPTWGKKAAITAGAVSAVAVAAVVAAVFETADRSAPAEVQTPQYGAIALSPSGGYGFSYNYADRSRAETRALSACAKNDCAIATWFFNGCGALATSGNRVWAAQDKSGQRARLLAQARCSEEGGSNCQVIVSDCSGTADTVDEKMLRDELSDYQYARHMGDVSRVCSAAGSIEQRYFNLREQENYRKWKRIYADCRR